MSRYLFMTGDTMKFDEIAKIKKGDVFYEVDMGFIMKGVALEDAIVYRDDIFDKDDKIAYSAEVYDLVKDKYEGPRKVDYKCIRNMMHYGGKFYSEIGVWDREEQKELGDIEKFLANV